MSDSPHDELLSAYLDGELTADQQAQVERRLASDPRARQWLDELRALRATLQELPEQQLDEDLAPAVLRLAERRMLAEPSSAAEARPASRVRQMFATVGRRLLNPRGVAWAAVTLVVAALLWINQQGRQLQVAQTLRETQEAAPARTAPADHQPPVIRAVPGDESAETAAQAAHDDRHTDAGVAAGHPLTEKGAFKGALGGVAPEAPAAELSSGVGGANEPLPSKAGGGVRSTVPPAEPVPAEGQLAETLGAGEQVPAPTLLAKAPGQPLSAPAAAPPAPVADTVEQIIQTDEARAGVPGQPSAPAAPPAGAPTAKSAPESGIALAEPSAGERAQDFAGSPNQAGMGFGALAGKAGLRDQAGAAPAAVPAAQSDGLANVAGEQETAQHLVQRLAARQARPTEPQAGGGLMLVYCDVSPAALQNRTLDKVLLRNGIVFEEPDEQQGVQLEAAEEPAEEHRPGPAGEPGMEVDRLGAESSRDESSPAESSRAETQSAQAEQAKRKEEVASQEPAGAGRFRQDMRPPQELSRSTQLPQTAQAPAMGPGRSGVARAQADRMVPEFAEPVVQGSAATTEGVTPGAGHHGRRSAATGGAPVQQIPVEAIYVEAAPQQISMALEELALQRSEVVSLSIQPAPGVAAQNALALRYNRRAATEEKPAEAKWAGPAESEGGPSALSMAGAAPESPPAAEAPSGAAGQSHGTLPAGPTAKSALRPQGRAQRVPLLAESSTIQQRAGQVALEAQQHVRPPAAENALQQQPRPQPSADAPTRQRVMQRAMGLKPEPYQAQAPEQSQSASDAGQPQATPGEGPAAIRKPQTPAEEAPRAPQAPGTEKEEPAGSAARHAPEGASRQLSGVVGGSTQTPERLQVLFIVRLVDAAPGNTAAAGEAAREAAPVQEAQQRAEDATILPSQPAAPAAKHQ